VTLTTGILDLADNGLQTQHVWTFTTAAASNAGTFLNCAANAAETASAGDNNGFQSGATNACADGGGAAIDTSSGIGSNSSCTSSKVDKHRFYNFGIVLAPGAAITGIEVRLDAFRGSSGAGNMCVQLSWDGGASWTAAKTIPLLTTSEQSYLIGSPTDTWGRAWTAANLSNANFRVRVINVGSNGTSFNLDWVAVKVTTSP
jgi:hypothetical protein